MEDKRRCLADEVTLLCTKDVLTDVRNGCKRRKRETYPHTHTLRIRGIRFHGEKTGSEGFFSSGIFFFTFLDGETGWPEGWKVTKIERHHSDIGIEKEKNVFSVGKSILQTYQISKDT